MKNINKFRQRLNSQKNDKLNKTGTKINKFIFNKKYIFIYCEKKIKCY